MASEKPPAPVVNLADGDLAQMSKNERIKNASEGLFYVQTAKGERHTFADEISALDRGESQTISGEAKELSKFFGVYKQQGRGERGKKIDDHFFMVRIKAPAGGGFSRDQWLALDRAADDYADGTLRVTSRQGIQYHHIYGPKLAPLIPTPQSRLSRRRDARRLRRRQSQRDGLPDRRPRPGVRDRRVRSLVRTRR